MHAETCVFNGIAQRGIVSQGTSGEGSRWAAAMVDMARARQLLRVSAPLFELMEPLRAAFVSHLIVIAICCLPHVRRTPAREAVTQPVTTQPACQGRSLRRSGGSGSAQKRSGCDRRRKQQRFQTALQQMSLQFRSRASSRWAPDRQRPPGACGPSCSPSCHPCCSCQLPAPPFSQFMHAPCIGREALRYVA